MRPTTREILVEWIDSINFLKDSTRFLPAAYAFYHFITFGIFVYFIVLYLSVYSIVAVAAIGVFTGTVYNTGLSLSEN